jgi:hypothetical protein
MLVDTDGILGMQHESSFVPPNKSVLTVAVPTQLYGFAAGIMSTSLTNRGDDRWRGARAGACTKIDQINVALRSAAVLAVVSSDGQPARGLGDRSPSPHLP